ESSLTARQFFGITRRRNRLCTFRKKLSHYNFPKVTSRRWSPGCMALVLSSQSVSALGCFHQGFRFPVQDTEFQLLGPMHPGSLAELHGLRQAAFGLLGVPELLMGQGQKQPVLDRSLLHPAFGDGFQQPFDGILEPPGSVQDGSEGVETARAIRILR